MIVGTRTGVGGGVAMAGGVLVGIEVAVGIGVEAGMAVAVGVGRGLGSRTSKDQNQHNQTNEQKQLVCYHVLTPTGARTSFTKIMIGGAEGIRTLDPLRAKLVLHRLRQSLRIYR